MVSSRLVVVLLGICSFTAIHGLSCITLPVKYTIKKADATATSIRKKLSSLNISKVANDSLCLLHMCALSDTSPITVQFNGLLLNLGLSHGQIRFETVLDTNQKGVVSTQNCMSYACSKQDGCEKKFIYDHIRWFSKEYFKELEEAVRPLFKNGIESKGQYHEHDFSSKAVTEFGGKIRTLRDDDTYRLLTKLCQSC